jgi:thiol-disulfide isomerase/thioredoxin
MVKGMKTKMNRAMVENVVIFVLLAVIVGLLVNYYLKGNQGNESFQGGNVRLVLYHAPWCPHCVKFMPEWKALGNNKEINGKNVEIEAIDCEANPEAAERENVSGFHTVKLYVGDESHEYDGARDSATLILWVKKMVV